MKWSCFPCAVNPSGVLPCGEPYTVIPILPEIEELCQIIIFCANFEFYYGAAGQGGGDSGVSVAHRYSSGGGCTTRRLDSIEHFKSGHRCGHGPAGREK
jgi:hypothetical protein